VLKYFIYKLIFVKIFFTLLTVMAKVSIMPTMKNHTILITTPKHLLLYLIKELYLFKFGDFSLHPAGIALKGSLEDIMFLNLHLRCAHHIHLLVKEFFCQNPDELYKEIYKIPWEDFIFEDGYISIFSNISTPTINNSQFANVRCKDAIVDRLLKIKGRRPDSGPKKDKTVIYLYWKNQDCAIYLDTSAEPLSRRNYRKNPYRAPLQETLAAALILATGYDATMPLINPMCGSGTLAIEAALIALNYAPGLLRNNFGFMHIKGFDKKQWGKLCCLAQNKIKRTLPVAIIASDKDKKAVEAAKNNTQAAGIADFIKFYICDFANTFIPKEKGIIIVNPEYGERLGEISELEKTYKRLGDFFKQKCAGYTCYVFTGNLTLVKKIGLRTSQRLQFFNANIECRLLKYEMYTGLTMGHRQAPRF
jgi:putative N6-adenine-specific DNA methylase